MTGHEAVQTVLDELVRGFPNEDAWTLGERALRRLSREQIERCAQVWLVEEVDAQRRRTARKTEEQHTRQRRRQPRKRREQDRERRDNREAERTECFERWRDEPGTYPPG